MRKFIYHFVLLMLMALFPHELALAQSRGQGVGALAGTTNGSTFITISDGHTAPWAEVIVETAGADVQAVAEVDRGGKFTFSFNTTAANVGTLKIYGVDEAGVTQSIPVGGTLLSDFLLPPTIIGNTTGLPVTSVGLEGYSFPGATVSVTMNATWGYEKSFTTTADGTTGKWSYRVENLSGGIYTATAKATYQLLESNKSQDLTFTIGGPTPTPTPGGLVSTIVGGSAQLIAALTQTVSQALDAIPESAKQQADTASKVLVPVTAAVILWQSGLLQLLLSFDYLTTGARILLGLFIPMKRKKNRWGVVYDAVTKQPVVGAIVRLYRASGDLIETEATGKTGIFSFLPGEGQYEIKVSLPGYIFPSKLVAGSEDGEYQSIYRGDLFTISSRNPVVNLSIPMDPKGYEGRLAMNTFKNMFLRLSWYANIGLYVVGLGLSVISYVANPVIYNQIVLVFYAVTFAYFVHKVYRDRAKWGIALDIGGKPASGVALSLLDSVFRRLVQRRVTDNLGRYQFVVPQGGYIMLVTSPDWELAPLANGYNGSVIEVAKKVGVVKARVIVKKKAPRGFGE